MEASRRRQIVASAISSAMGAALVGAGLILSRTHPLAGGIGSGVMLGTLLAFAHLVWRPAPRVAAGLAIAGVATGLAQAWVNPAALGYGAGAALAALALWYVGVEVVGLGYVNRERVSPVTDLGGSGSAGRALIVYHSQAGRFQPAVERSLAAGLQSQGWQVHLTTASHATPTDLSGYRLLVLGAPTFAAQPARAILAFLRRVGDLRGMAVMLVVSGQGSTALALEMLQSAVVAANGRIVDALEIWTQRDNLERHGLRDPLEILRRRGEHLHVA